VPGLASGIHISISIETRRLVSTGETGGRRGGQDGIVHTRLTWH